MLRLCALFVLLAAPVAAQGILTATPNPYDGSSLDVPLVLRNDGTAPLTLDSLGFMSRYTRYEPIGLSVGLRDGDGDYVTGATCTLPARACVGDTVPLAQIAPGDSLLSYVSTYCEICREGRAPGFDHFPDTLLVWTDGQPTPAEVVVTDAFFVVASAETPAAPTLSLSVVPIPARGTATVRLTLAAPSAVRVTVFDALGRAVRTLDGTHPSGETRLPVSLAGLAPGVYAVRAEAGEAVATARLVVSR